MKFAGASRKVQCDVCRVADLDDMSQTRIDTGKKRELRTVRWIYRSTTGDIKYFNLADATKLCDAQHRSHMLGKGASTVVQLQHGNADIAQQTFLTDQNVVHSLLTVPFVLTDSFRQSTYSSSSTKSKEADVNMVWQVLTDSGWMDYDTKNSSILSAAYQQHKSTAIVKGPQNVAGACMSYIVDLSAMHQSRADGTGTMPRRVRVQFRHHPSETPSDTGWNAVDIGSGSEPPLGGASVLPPSAPPRETEPTVPDTPVEVEIPQDYCCPITQELFEDPVIAMDGHTYERLHIVKWLESHETSPFTGEVMESKHLVPNHRLKSIVREWREKNDQK
eukprot:m.407163 g.407163  ORF g.407163 m.407163 type:complete len:333 (+) comp21219_c0_seq10:1058-2056(+)